MKIIAVIGLFLIGCSHMVQPQQTEPETQKPAKDEPKPALKLQISALNNTVQECKAVKPEHRPILQKWNAILKLNDDEIIQPLSEFLSRYGYFAESREGQYFDKITEEDGCGSYSKTFVKEWSKTGVEVFRLDSKNKAIKRWHLIRYPSIVELDGDTLYIQSYLESVCSEELKNQFGKDQYGQPDPTVQSNKRIRFAISSGGKVQIIGLGSDYESKSEHQSCNADLSKYNKDWANSPGFCFEVKDGKTKKSIKFWEPEPCT